MLRIDKPWGYEEILTRSVDENYTARREIEEHYTVKRIVVNAGARLSLQSHEHKVETMILVEGEAWLTHNGVTTRMMPQYPEYIKAGVKHRLSAGKFEGCVVIEVSQGEDEDIIRWEDDYGR